ncbi:MAG: hypothetical protein WA708_07065 [Acidobacteriaceae bacterium]
MKLSTTPLEVIYLRTTSLKHNPRNPSYNPSMEPTDVFEFTDARALLGLV